MGLRAVRVAGIVAIGLLAAACSGLPFANENAGGVGAADQPSVAASGIKNSPLDEFRMALWGTNWGSDMLSEDERRLLFNEEFARQEELVAQCMLEAGFEYIPDVEAYTLIFPTEEEWNPNSREWVAQNGFGRNGMQPGTMMASTSYPNEAIRNRLTPAELQAYILALHGRILGDNSLTQEEREALWYEPPTLENVGCMGVAGIQARAGDNFRGNDEFAPLFEALNEMQENLRTEITDFDREWATCMADAGWRDFERQAQARLWLQDEFMDIQSSWDWENDGWNLAGSPRMVAHREREIELALADFDCRAEVDFESRQETRRISTETQFVNDHRTALVALRAAAEQRG